MALSLEAGRALLALTERIPLLHSAEVALLQNALGSLERWHAFLDTDGVVRDEAADAAALRVRALLLEWHYQKRVRRGWRPDWLDRIPAASQPSPRDEHDTQVTPVPDFLLTEWDDCFYTLEDEEDNWAAVLAERTNHASSSPSASAAGAGTGANAVGGGVTTTEADSTPAAVPPMSGDAPDMVGVVNNGTPELAQGSMDRVNEDLEGALPTSAGMTINSVMALAHPPVLPPPPVIPDVELGSTGRKYLWQAALNPDLGEHALTPAELQALLSDSKQTHSRWFDENKVNQEELYLALENVLKTLLNFRSHSWPFIKPVTKKEAKDYDLIVKRPMSLSRIQEKGVRCMLQLNDKLYKSKQEFVDDMYLIISNCKLYNGTDINNIYVRHAEAMKKKMDALFPRIPNLEVLDRNAGEGITGDPTAAAEANPFLDAVEASAPGGLEESATGDADLSEFSTPVKASAASEPDRMPDQRPATPVASALPPDESVGRSSPPVDKAAKALSPSAMATDVRSRTVSAVGDRTPPSPPAIPAGAAGAAATAGATTGAPTPSPDEGAMDVAPSDGASDFVDGCC